MFHWLLRSGRKMWLYDALSVCNLGILVQYVMPLHRFAGCRGALSPVTSELAISYYRKQDVDSQLNACIIDTLAEGIWCWPAWMNGEWIELYECKVLVIESSSTICTIPGSPRITGEWIDARELNWSIDKWFILHQFSEIWVGQDDNWASGGSIIIKCAKWLDRSQFNVYLEERPKPRVLLIVSLRSYIPIVASGCNVAENGANIW